MVEDIGRGRFKNLQGAFHAALASEVRNQYFQLDTGAQLTDTGQATHIMFSTALTQVITVNRGNYHVTQFHIVNGARQAFRFVIIRWIRPAMGHITK